MIRNLKQIFLLLLLLLIGVQFYQQSTQVYDPGTTTLGYKIVVDGYRGQLVQVANDITIGDDIYAYTDDKIVKGTVVEQQIENGKTIIAQDGLYITLSDVPMYTVVIPFVGLILLTLILILFFLFI